MDARVGPASRPSTVPTLAEITADPTRAEADKALAWLRAEGTGGKDSACV